MRAGPLSCRSDLREHPVGAVTSVSANGGLTFKEVE